MSHQFNGGGRRADLVGVNREILSHNSVLLKEAKRERKTKN